jgi:uncharacterized protein YjhX (UPF0386 family)
VIAALGDDADSALAAGMFDDANAELQRIDAFNRAALEVFRVRVAIFQGLKNWDAVASRGRPTIPCS